MDTIINNKYYVKKCFSIVKANLSCKGEEWNKVCFFKYITRPHSLKWSGKSLTFPPLPTLTGENVLAISNKFGYKDLLL